MTSDEGTMNSFEISYDILPSPRRKEKKKDVEMHDYVDMVVGSEDFEAADEIVEDGRLCRSDPFFCVAFGVNSQIGGSPVFVSSVFLSAKQKCPE